MNEKVTVRSAKDYFQAYGVNGIGKGADRMMVRSQLIDAFRKEIFGLIAMRTKKQLNDIPEEDPEAKRISQNIIRDETKKWISLCRMFAQYEETKGLLEKDDLKEIIA